MHLKQTATSFGVPLVYTLTITLSSVGRCEPAAPLHPTPPQALHDDRSLLTTSSLSQPSSQVTRWGHLGSGRGEEDSIILPQTLTDLIQKRSSSGPGSEPRAAPSGSRSHKRRQTDKEKLLRSNRPPQGNCSRGVIKHMFPGKFYITGHFEPNIKHLHQVDPALSQEGPVRRSSQESSSNQSWQKLEPSVECGDKSMLLTVRRKRAMQLLLDRANESSLLLFQLPPQCGYSVRTTVRDFILKAQYDACHVTLQDGSRVLPLLWRGIPVKVSCPVSQIGLPGEGPTSLCCSPNGMTFRLGGLPAEEPRINVRGEWTPLSLLAKQCGYTLHQRAAGILIAAPFLTCGVTVKDGKHTLSLQMGKKTYMLACPIPPLEKPPVAHQSLADGPPDLAKRAAEPNLESLGPLPWIPPFYLAPPNYPHPTYPQLKERVSNGSPNPPSLTREAALSQSKHKDHYYHQVPPKEAYISPQHQMNSGQVYQHKHPEVPVLDLLENSITATRFPVQVETPHPPPPGHDFSSYYHYYHLPKIPLPGNPQNPDPGPGLPGGSQPSTNSEKQEFPPTLPNLQLSEPLDKDASDKVPLPVTTPSAHTLPTNSKVSALYASYPLQPFPFFYYYFPHVFKGEAKRLGLLHPGLNAKTNLSFVLSPHSLVHSGQEKHVNPALNTGKTDKTDLWKQHDGNERRTASVTPVVQFPASQSYTPKPAPPPEQHVLPTPGFTYNADPYKYYYHPYYNYYLKYYAPKVLRGTHNHGTQTTTKAAAPSGRPSHHEHQTIPPPADYDILKRLYPYHYYYLYYLHQMLQYNQKLHHHGVEDMSASQLSSNIDSSEVQRSAAEAGRSSLYSPQLPPSKPSEQHGGPGVKGKLGKEMRDTVGQFLVLAVPDSVVDPSAAPPALPPDDDKDSCGLQQQLTPHPDIYVIPQDSCGLNKHLFGQITGQNLDLQSIQSHGDSSSLPVRLVVGCSSSPPPGEVRFNTMDEPPPPSAQQTPAAATVLLRITADESFSSFYPEAHLPLSLVQGRPVFVELRLLQPSEPNVVLLVHSCLAYTQTPELRWILFYDSCSRGDISQLLPSSDPRHIQRIKIPSFPSLPVGGSPYRVHGGPMTLEDPEVYFLCLTELCSTAHGACSSCIKGKVLKQVLVLQGHYPAGFRGFPADSKDRLYPFV